MGRAYGEHKMLIQKFNGETTWKDVTCKTKAYMGGYVKTYIEEIFMMKATHRGPNGKPLFYSDKCCVA
jgi:hypothetical protein